MIKVPTSDVQVELGHFPAADAKKQHDDDAIVGKKKTSTAADDEEREKAMSNFGGRGCVLNFLFENYPSNPAADIRDFHKFGFAIPILALYYIGFNVLLIYFTVTSTLTLWNSSFISLESSNMDQLCTEIPKAISASFEGDNKGAWQTDNNFKQTNSIYLLKFSGSEINQETYSSAMTSFDDKLKQIGDRSATRDLAWQLIAWGTFNAFDKETDMTFSTNGNIATSFKDIGTYIISFTTFTPAVIDADGKDVGLNFCFESDIAVPQIGNEAAFDYSLVLMRAVTKNYGRTISVSMDLKWTNLDDNGETSEYYKGPCPGFFSPMETFDIDGIDYFYNKISTLVLEFDTQSIMTAISVNFGIMPLSELSEVQHDPFSGKYPSNMKFYIDEFYAPMTPIVCMDKGSIYNKKTLMAPLCLLADQKTLIYPVFKNSKKCDCSNTTKLMTKDEAYDCTSPLEIIFVYDKIGYNSMHFNGSDAMNLGFKMANYIAEDPVGGDLKIVKYLADLSVEFDTMESMYKSTKLSNLLFKKICPKDTCGSFSIKGFADPFRQLAINGN